MFLTSHIPATQVELIDMAVFVHDCRLLFIVHISSVCDLIIYVAPIPESQSKETIVNESARAGAGAGVGVGESVIMLLEG